MSTLCCDKNIPNTGIPACATAIPKAVGMFIQAKYANDGVRNSIEIDGTTVVGGMVDINALTAEVDPSKRLYPITSMKDIDITPSEPQYRTFKDQTKELTQEAIYSFIGMIAGDGIPPAIVGYLKKTRCREYQFYLIGSDGCFIGEINGTKLFGIDWVGFYAMGGFASFEKQADVTVRFDLDPNFKYENLYMLTPDVISTNLLESKGVIPVDIAVVSTTSTTAQIRVSHRYGNGLVNKNNWVGLTTANLRVKRLDTGVVLTPTTVTEDVINQKYDLVFTSIPATTQYEIYTNLTPSFKVEGLAGGLIGV